jgi:hypothetical protein
MSESVTTRPFRISSDAFCLDEMSLRRFYSANLLTVPVREVRVLTRGMGQSHIKVSQVQILVGKRLKDFLADVVTGTLYDPTTGWCMSSINRNIIGADL